MPPTPPPASRATPLIIGVVGGSGSGKTTVANAIREATGVGTSLIDQDAYYKDQGHIPFEQRKLGNFDHPDALDNDLLAQHLGQLARGKAIEKPIYDYAHHTRGKGGTRVEPSDIVVVEGILLFADAGLRQLFDIKIFVDVADDVRFIRRLQRDVSERGRSVDDVIRHYLATVRPMHLEFVEPSKRWADIILPEGGHNRIGVEMIIARVLLEIRRRKETL